MYRVPRATYRLQFNAGFTFADAREIVPYLAELGISDIYASPILKARKGSGHGYDVVDANALNPELGTDDDFNALHDELQRRQLGLLLDVVPNHMAASPENAWWMSVLENGEHSRFLHYFDIDWTPVTTRGQTVSKVLLPILGKPYGDALEWREIQLHFDVDGFFFTYYDKRLPLAPGSYGQVLRECVESLPREGVAIELRELVENDDSVPNSRFLKETLWRIYEQDETFRDALHAAIQGINCDSDPLDALLDAQWYRLAYWRIASEKINYRRFFDVTDLVGVRVENPEVFEARNRRTLELIAEGKVTGLRIDHIDGLYDPIGHMRKLQLRLAGEPSGDDRFYIVVEKILEHGEELPREFPVSGTTGYDFLDSVNALFVDANGLQQLDRFYRNFTGVTATFDDICYERKKQIIHELFSGEMRSLGKQLGAVAMPDRNARDFAPVDLTAALTEVTACMRVYRTYIREATVDDDDVQSIRAAIAEARRRAAKTIDERLFTFLERVLLVDPPAYVESERENWLAFVMRWQQFTGRVMAKGVEDTAFYNYNRLISLNEVGGDPGRGADFDGLAEFHARASQMQQLWPHTMNATSTHDTKRSEDVRARINVLSEIAPQWERQVRRWSKMNAPHRANGVPDANTELLIYETLIGMWPLDNEDLPSVRDRLKQYLEKAAREAKTHTSWITPNAAYEESLLAFADAILSDAAFCEDLVRIQKRIAFYGFLNGLSQVVLKATAPGAPDFYQGTELWDFSLVDPDNRRPIDYASRSAMLKKMKAAAEKDSLSIDTLLRRWHDSRIKMFVTWKVLDARSRHADLFRDGTYEPLDAGPNVVAFMRRHEEDAVVIAVPRLIANLVKLGTFPLGDVWPAASIPIAGSWRNLFTEESLEGDQIPLRSLFSRFPVAVLEKA
ncbi:MAG: (1-_4)-alpha-D-glucan 1-alpha-D-glucosylmutase [Thermoanaerobaculia bacterium]|jgi:(1->4)-alpha-D-glucan 1-alpha-D-glucosylmutase|nr:(1->4)-alpha-D-glucan 1-alpha-D-glucosylmutase [Thermoanaerobaculia bacterium]